MVKDKKKTGGGAATNSGIDYQASVAAYYLTKVIAKGGATLPYRLPADDKFVRIDFETDEPTDDLNITTYLGSNIFVQAKRSLSLSASDDSELAESVEQFVEQYLIAMSNGSYSADSKRYILAYNGNSPQTLDRAAQALDKLRSGTPTKRLPVDEQKNLGTITDHIRRLLKSKNSVEYTDTNVMELLSSIYLHRLDVLDDGRDALAAQDTLRNIIANPEHATLAWNTLRIDSVSSGRKRGSIELENLVAELGSKSMPLSTSVNFSKDIAKLKEYTKTVTVPILERSSVVNIDGLSVKFERKLVQVMRNASDEGQSFLVVGEPGAGKSGSLYELISSLQVEGADVLAIAAEQISSSSFGELQNEFNLENSLSSVLMNWRGSNKAIVVIDALDAARNPEALKLFIDLARQIINLAGRWTVVISTRKYDLRHNKDLKDLLPQAQLSEFIDPEFSTAHVNVPVLTNEERDAFVKQSPKLGALVQKAGLRMRELMRSPFNIKIAAEIMSSGVDISELTEIDTQIGLLDRYWDVRVNNAGGDGISVNLLISSIAGNMVKTQSLKVQKLDIARENPTLTGQLNTLLSSDVLSEEKRNDNLSFSHHIIYDYAVYRTMLRSANGGIRRLLTENPYLALSIRPSIQMYWQYLWQSDATRRQFWAEIVNIEMDVNISRLAKLLGLQVAIESIKVADDVAPLIEAIRNGTIAEKDAALSIYKCCSDTMTATKKRGEPDNAERWIPAVNETLSFIDDYPTRAASCSILESAVEKWSDVLIDRKTQAGTAARKLLEDEISKAPPNKYVLRTAIKLVVNTYGTNSIESSRVLNMLLEEKMVSEYGHMYLGDVAEYVGQLTNLDNELVYKVFHTSFSYDEKSDEVTSMGNSQILGLNSNRRQDYNMVHWQLGQKYSSVADANMALALKALNIVLIESASRYGTNEETKAVIKTFPYYGSEQSVERSRAYIWDIELHTGSKGHDVYQAFTQHMDQLASRADGPDLLQKAIVKNAGIVNSSQFWVQMLAIGIKHPLTLGTVLVPLLSAKPLLQTPETISKLGEFMVLVYPTMDTVTREQLEKLVIKNPEQLNDKYGMRQAIAVRDDIFKNIDEGLLVTTEAKDIHAVQIRNTEAGEKDPPQTNWHDEDENFWERSKSDEDKALSKLVSGEEMSVNNIQPVEITSEKIVSLLDLIEQFEAALQENATATDVSKREVKQLISQAYEKICWSPEFTPNSDNWKDVCDKIVAIIDDRSLLPVISEDEQDEEDKMLSDYGARSLAVRALMVLANKETDAKRLELLRLRISELTSDQSPTVRFEIASHVNYLWHKGDSEFTWKIVNKIKDDEMISKIVHHLTSSLSYLRGVEPDLTYVALSEIYKKWQSSKNKELREMALQQIAESYVRKNNADAKKLLDEVLLQPLLYSPELDRVEVHLRDFLIYGIEDKDDKEAVEIRSRTRTVLVGILGSYDEDEEYQKWNKKHEGKRQTDLTKDDIQEVRSILGHSENIAKQIYFASGSHDEKTNKEDVLSEDAKKVFIDEQSELIDKIVTTGRVRSAHDFVEMALAYQDINPLWALRLVDQLISTSGPNGSTSESLMAGSVTTFIKRFIAGHREQLKDTKSQKLLINILEGFVETGWPEAINLMDDIEEVFR